MHEHVGGGVEVRHVVPLSEQVDALGEPRRTIIFLHYWMGCGVDEISGLTEIPTGTVKSHLFRARRALAEGLKGETIDG